MYSIVNDIVWLIIGAFFGSIVGNVIIYKLIHPYIGRPYLERKKKEMNRKRDEQKKR